MLLVMALIYIAARVIGPVHPAIGFIKAFAEAAMVGGLADWFAVTALFRHPLGLPIPHTAIIPRSKARIGNANELLWPGQFVKVEIVLGIESDDWEQTLDLTKGIPEDLLLYMFLTHLQGELVDLALGN